MKQKTTKNGPKKPFYKKGWFIGFAVIMILGGFGNALDDGTTDVAQTEPTETIISELTTEAIITDVTEIESTIANSVAKPNKQTTTEATSEIIVVAVNNKVNDTYSINSSNNSIKFKGKDYKIIKVDGGDLSGKREANVAVDIGFGDREYWAFTNEYAQLVYVMAQEVTLQDPNTEKVLSTGRYYSDEAKVPGTESPDLDEGHVIADSLGGVSNAYNITPQDSTLNRHGDQAYMEKVIRDANGCTDFFATITYPDNKTMIPSHYHFEYVVKGNTIADDFDNVNPDKVNASINTTEATTIAPTTESAKVPITTEAPTSSFNEATELKRIDTNGNGKVTIAEAKAAGFIMPIYSDFWLYKYMDDRDGDGKVGE